MSAWDVVLMLAWDVWVVVLMVAWDVWVVVWVDAWDGWAVVWAAAWDVWVVVVSWVDAWDGWVVVWVEAWDVKVVGSILMCPRFLGRVMESVLLWLPLGGMCLLEGMVPETQVLMLMGLVQDWPSSMVGVCWAGP